MLIGVQLRQARLERKLSYADVSKVTKIQPWILEAIEEDRALQAMSPVYAKGFINNYVKYLGLNLASLQTVEALVPQASVVALQPAPIVAAPVAVPVSVSMAVASVPVEVAAASPAKRVRARRTKVVATVTVAELTPARAAVAKPVRPVVLAPVAEPASVLVRAVELTLVRPEVVSLETVSKEPVLAPAVAAVPLAQAKEPLVLRIPEIRIPQIQIPRIQLPRFEMPRIEIPRFEIPWRLVARVGVVAASFAIIGAVIAIDPIKRLPKIAWNKPAQTKVASMAPVAMAGTKTPAPKAADSAALAAQKEFKAAAAKETREQDAPKQAAAVKENKETKEKKETKENKEAAAKETKENKEAAAKETAAKESKEKEAKAKEVAKKEEAKTAIAQPIIPASKPLELSINVKRNTWVQLWADGKLLVQQRLRRGVEEKWTAQKRFELVIANPSQIELVLNGTPISNAAVVNNGRLLITHKGVTKLADTPS